MSGFMKKVIPKEDDETINIEEARLKFINRGGLVVADIEGEDLSKIGDQNKN